ncbi:ATP-binding cassette domain-containing protein [Streptomyces albidoflavus]|uniref:ATP-binding cassette domain-containing protein n=1 Tax=Streptomyces TaxID=1883 RepID=UPI001012BF0A|nr:MULTISPECIES: ATP-binding cassette domain-containing protein [Streptomyces]MCU7705726.1 ATP-binding cassette domain-containing protein [Streptomyces albidoflavus]RZD70776.1 daunorubicin/doxorubicin resistance ABC transporter ATP-binding protein DrrA [Streptomyces albidoflavus]RZE06145.1 daunorubicin/doxorubicin resistance ABC transporter ATP-binding protein DrrA [Streptomyces albidoflavus]
MNGLHLPPAPLPAPGISAAGSGDLMIEAEGVSKAYGTVHALDSVSLAVPRGTVLGLLGHNGAGKTTLVDILTTALPPTSGRARVAGYDVADKPVEIRRRIGLTGQFASVDAQLSGYDNLVLIARLLGAGRRAARVRARELLELFRLTEVADRRASSYSGGLRRRLDLAVSLVGAPEVLFLDEPTTGLDPSSRINLWEIVEGLVEQGTTVLLTTQYLEEADRLADRIAVLSAGRVVAAGTAPELKATVGRRTVTLTLETGEDVSAARTALRGAGFAPVDGEARTVVVPIDATREIADIIRSLDQAGVEASELNFGEPTLDDVYLTLAEQAAGRTRA